MGNKSKAGATYASLGFSMKRRDITKAKGYMKKGILLLEESEDLIALNPTYDNYGIVLEINGQVDSAIYYYNLALGLLNDFLLLTVLVFVFVGDKQIMLSQ